MAFSIKDRQKIIDGYLSSTGRNLFVAPEFVDWLEEQPEHEAYDWFFGSGDAVAARQHRIDMARRMASGLRIQTHTDTTESKVVRITERVYPAYVSPVASRKLGGGYERFNPDNPQSMAELRRQGRVALRSWVERYGGAFDDTDLSVLEEIAASEDETESSTDDCVARPA